MLLQSSLHSEIDLHDSFLLRIHLINRDFSLMSVDWYQFIFAKFDLATALQWWSSPSIRIYFTDGFTDSFSTFPPIFNLARSSSCTSLDSVRKSNNYANEGLVRNSMHTCSGHSRLWCCCDLIYQRFYINPTFPKEACSWTGAARLTQCCSTLF